jgi:GntR family transcriptional regulator, transcriptional repressor for pyruvate dehydrogenase complex
MSGRPEQSLSELIEQVSAALEAVRAADTAVGARRIAEHLESLGIQTSESSVSRLLRRFDSQGWTRQIGAKGRVLTSAGIDELRRLERMRRHQETDPLDVRSLEDLHNLLVARRAVERENVRAAALKMSREDIQRLRRVNQQHKRAIERGDVPRSVALSFHRLVGASSGNKFLSSMTDLVFDQSLDATEAALDVIVTSHMSERFSVKEHSELIDAIQARDPDRAEEVMLGHINQLIDQVAEFRRTNTEHVFDSLLRLSLERDHRR